MTKLSKKAYWDAIYRDRPRGADASHPLKARVMRVANAVGGPRLVAAMGNYADHLMWDVIYPKYLPKRQGATVLEIGSAPGHALVQMHRRFGFVPYGLDYSDAGVKLNRSVFAANGLDPGNVIQDDFSSEGFHRQHRGRFDVVMSRGFVEHFADVEACVTRHVDLLAEGGTLLVSIPNLRGVNYFLSWIFNRDVLRAHNLDIMRKERFWKCFGDERLTPLFCDYVGTFDFSLFNADAGSPMRFALEVCRKAQVGLNVLWHLLFGDRGAETRLFSPYLLYIGTKRPA